ncbi:MAG: EAL domain-containing protein [bacterium]|nr:EAL domain-containing protein [bacterium]
MRELTEATKRRQPGTFASGAGKPLALAAAGRSSETLLSGEKRALEMIAANAPLQPILDTVNQVIEARLPGTLCSVLLLDPAERRLRHGSAPSLPEAYRAAIDGLAIGPEVGSCGTAAYLGRQVIVSDIASDPLWADYRELARRHSLAACWSTPIYSSTQEILGTFAVYYRESRAPTTVDLEVMERMTHLAGIAIERHRSDEATRELAEKLSFQATHDSLTGLLNRYEFERRMRRLLEEARRHQGEHALCYMDLDQFKIINDTCGHVAGDELLRQLGHLLGNQVFQRDTLARLGGDEFGVLLENCSLGKAKKVADTLRRAIEGFRFLWEGKSFSVGVSIGLVPISEASDSLTGILRAADSACYVAKDEGRNRIHTYRADDAELARRSGEMRWVNRIRLALEEDRFHLEFQPIVDVCGPRTPGEHFELLLRMEDEEGRQVAPEAFMPAAERYQLATKIDYWVLGSAFDWLISEPGLLERVRLCSINLSAQSLGDLDFLRFVLRGIEEKRIPPERICFEITETAAIANLSQANHFIRTLRTLGCRFALDDFGTGFSSFAYLKSLPVDYLKIDGMFVTELAEDRIDQAVVRSMVEIGKVMGKRTIAEAVESEIVLGKLRAIGVDYAQGNAIGRPLPIEAFAGAIEAEEAAEASAPELESENGTRQLRLPY